MAWFFGMYGYKSALSDTTAVVTERAHESNDFAAKLAAQRVAGEIDRYYRSVEQVAGDNEFQTLLVQALQNDELRELLKDLGDPQTAGGFLAAVPTKQVDSIAAELAVAGFASTTVGMLTDGPPEIVLANR